MVGFLNGLQADLLRRGALSSLDAFENIEARSLMEWRPRGISSAADFLPGTLFDLDPLEL